MSELDYLYNLPRGWLLERWDVMYRVGQDIPEGVIKNKWWVETREWDAIPTMQESIQTHFKRTAMDYKNHE